MRPNKSTSNSHPKQNLIIYRISRKNTTARKSLKTSISTLTISKTKSWMLWRKFTSFQTHQEVRLLVATRMIKFLGKCSFLARFHPKIRTKFSKTQVRFRSLRGINLTTNRRCHASTTRLYSQMSHLRCPKIQSRCQMGLVLPRAATRSRSRCRIALSVTISRV